MPGTSSKIQIPKEMLAFYQKLKQVQDKYSGNCQFTVKEDKDTGWSRNSDCRMPLIRLYEPHFQSERLYQACKEIAALVAEYRPKVKNDIDKINGIPHKVLSGIIEAAVTGDLEHSPENAEPLGLNTYLLKFIVANTVKPFLSAFAQTVSEEVRTGSWGESFCPVCGNRPHIGRLAKEDGKRYLRCSLCDTEWLYKRLMCYNCGNEDHDSLSFLLVEETPGYQIDVCDVCKSYLKIIDERTGSNPDLHLGDVQTVYLDLIARQRGYSNDITNA